MSRNLGAMLNSQSDIHPQKVWPSTQASVFSLAQKTLKWHGRLLEVSRRYMKLKPYQDFFFTKKETTRGMVLPEFKIYCETRVMKNPLHFHKNREVDQ